MPKTRVIKLIPKHTKKTIEISDSEMKTIEISDSETTTIEISDLEMKTIEISDLETKTIEISDSDCGVEAQEEEEEACGVHDK